MQIKIEHLTARALAGLIYSGKVQHTAVAQHLEELGHEAKLERIETLLEDMNAVNDYYATTR